MTPEQLRTRLEQLGPGTRVEITDLTGTQDHYQARIVSSAFDGKSAIEQHRLVYGALGPAMHGPIHALALTTYSKAAWAKINGEK
jgi:stress-induced morphogen